MSWQRKSWVHMAGGFALMGGWAVFANRSFDMPAPLIAGVVQGTLTAVLTLVMKQVIEAVARRFDGLAGAVLPVLAVGGMSVTILSVIHGVAGTPALLATISVPFLVSSTYAAIYTLSLKGTS
ncbi:hypothetical protein [Aliiroseovarius subalbicans]|uniref:hypothetical protein n=1 Tax=Aliiroseovarius subalbicans TaxID=2925840 RepID=UPI001F589DC7|nr:hypothetical protein [Aliiroseovarius subalbicans]MCI2399441.1 hypothetical protein [Aliiroseovarius subalbicans]